MAQSDSKITKEDAQRALADVSQEHVFRCCDGKVLKSLRELMAALDSMTDETYACHCSQNKNDFSAWVMDGVGDEKLAEDLAGAHNKRKAADTVADRIIYLEKRAF